MVATNPVRVIERANALQWQARHGSNHNGMAPLWAPIAAICLLLLAPNLPDDVLLKRPTPAMGAMAVLLDTRNNLDA